MRAAAGDHSPETIASGKGGQPRVDLLKIFLRIIIHDFFSCAPGSACIEGFTQSKRETPPK